MEVRNNVDLGFCHGHSSSNSHGLNAHCEENTMETSEETELNPRGDGKTRDGLRGPSGMKTERT